MKPIHLLASLFAILLIVLDLAVQNGLRTDYDRSLMLFLGLALGQLALLACWCAVVSPRWSVARPIAVLLAAAALSWPLGEATGSTWAEWFTLFCLFAATMAGLVVLLRWSGFSLPERAVARAVHCTGPSQRNLQFSLASLFSALTMLGLACGVAGHVEFPVGQGLAVAGYGSGFILLAVATFAVIGARRGLLSRLLGLSTLCFLVGWAMTRIERQQDVRFFTTIALVEVLVLCAGVAVVQMGLDADRDSRPASPHG